MNERLKQLAIESKLIAPEYNGFDHTRLSISQQRFAELIVAECAGICHKMAEDSDSYVVHDGDTCAEQIKKHFGVEE